MVRLAGISVISGTYREIKRENRTLLQAFRDIDVFVGAIEITHDFVGATSITLNSIGATTTTFDLLSILSG